MPSSASVPGDRMYSVLTSLLRGSKIWSGKVWAKWATDAEGMHPLLTPQSDCRFSSLCANYLAEFKPEALKLEALKLEALKLWSFEALSHWRLTTWASYTNMWSCCTTGQTVLCNYPFQLLLSLTTCLHQNVEKDCPSRECRTPTTIQSKVVNFHKNKSFLSLKNLPISS